MNSKILNLTSNLTEIDVKLSLIDANEILFVLDDMQKLYGIINKYDVIRHFNESNPADYKETFAKDICNTDFLCFNFENLENDILEYFNSGGDRHNREIPVIDNGKNLITSININSLETYFRFADSQKYEFNFWNKPSVLSNLRNKINQTRKITEQKIVENIFPISNNDLNTQITNYTQNKSCLEIGSGPRGGYISKMWWARKRVVIEPLVSSYIKMLNTTGLYNIFAEMDEVHNKGADVFIPELKNSIDGMIICKNALDHTPHWPFILSNISSYAQKGSYFYLWTDIQHSKRPNEGHYNITVNKDNMFRMIECLGYDILFSNTNKPQERENIFVQVVAVKK